MDWLKRLFAGGMDASRANPVGLALMALAVLLVMLAGKIAGRLGNNAPEKTKNAIKITGLIICAGGALLAILG